MFTTLINIGEIKLFTKVFNSNFDPEQKIDPAQKTLILLHGGPGMDHSHFLKTWATHIDSCQLILFDQRGNGRSDYSNPAKWSLAQWAQDLADFCTALQLQHKPFIGGMSFGTHVALTFATHYPDMPAGLILTEADARFNKKRFLTALSNKAQRNNVEPDPIVQAAIDVFANYNEQTAAKYFSLVAPYFASPNFNGVNDYEEMILNVPCSKHYIEGEFQTFDLRSSLHKIKCPVLLLTGDQNPFHSLENAQEIAKELPKELIEFHVFPGEGTELHNHIPEKMMSLIKAFIDKIKLTKFSKKEV